MSWNYRVIKRTYAHTNAEPEAIFSIGEVYYDENGKPNGYSDNTFPVGDSVHELGQVLEMMRSALSKKVIEVSGDSMKEID